MKGSAWKSFVLIFLHALPKSTDSWIWQVGQKPIVECWLNRSSKSAVQDSAGGEFVSSKLWY